MAGIDVSPGVCHIVTTIAVARKVLKLDMSAVSFPGVRLRQDDPVPRSAGTVGFLSARLRSAPAMPPTTLAPHPPVHGPGEFTGAI